MIKTTDLEDMITDILMNHLPDHDRYVSFDISSISGVDDLWGWRPRHASNNKQGFPSLICKVYISGSSGGDCWGGVAERFSNGNRHVDPLEPIKLLADKHMPDLLYSDYRRMEGLVNEDEFTYDEYYGNSRDYRVYMIRLDKLADIINESGTPVMGIVDEEGPSP